MIDFAKAYEEKNKGFSIFPRSNTPKQDRLLLYGAPKCGKSALALDLARSYKHQILVDCADLRLHKERAQASLLKLFLEKKFGVLIIDNYLPEITIPSHPNIILITTKITHISESIRASFHTHCVRALSFEEYVSFSKGNRLESIFASFLKEGNLPEIALMPEHKRIQRIQEITLLYAKQDTSILAFLLHYQAKPFKTHNAFCLLKQQQKISKDKIYAFVQTLLDDQVVFTLTHKNGKESKLYFYNFALPYAISPTPSFQAIFENMIACELLHKSLAITYDDTCDFILQGTALFATPFPNQALIESKLSKAGAMYKECIFISIDTAIPQTTSHLGTYRAMSFIDFGLDYLCGYK